MSATWPWFRTTAPATSGWRSPSREVAVKHAAVLLANHGPVIAGKSLSDALYALEELEETAKLHFLLHGHPTKNR